MARKRVTPPYEPRRVELIGHTSLAEARIAEAQASIDSLATALYEGAYDSRDGRAGEWQVTLDVVNPMQTALATIAHDLAILGYRLSTLPGAGAPAEGSTRAYGSDPVSTGG